MLGIAKHYIFCFFLLVLWHVPLFAAPTKSNSISIEVSSEGELVPEYSNGLSPELVEKLNKSIQMLNSQSVNQGSGLGVLELIAEANLRQILAIGIQSCVQRLSGQLPSISKELATATCICLNNEVQLGGGTAYFRKTQSSREKIIILGKCNESAVNTFYGQLVKANLCSTPAASVEPKVVKSEDSTKDAIGSCRYFSVYNKNNKGCEHICGSNQILVSADEIRKNFTPGINFPEPSSYLSPPYEVEKKDKFYFFDFTELSVDPETGRYEGPGKAIFDTAFSTDPDEIAKAINFSGEHFCVPCPEGSIKSNSENLCLKGGCDVFTNQVWNQKLGKCVENCEAKIIAESGKCMPDFAKSCEEAFVTVEQATKELLRTVEVKVRKANFKMWATMHFKNAFAQYDVSRCSTNQLYQATKNTLQANLKKLPQWKNKCKPWAEQVEAEEAYGTSPFEEYAAQYGINKESQLFSGFEKEVLKHCDARVCGYPMVWDKKLEKCMEATKSRCPCAKFDSQIRYFVSENYVQVLQDRNLFFDFGSCQPHQVTAVSKLLLQESFNEQIQELELCQRGEIESCHEKDFDDFYPKLREIKALLRIEKICLP